MERRERLSAAAAAAAAQRWKGGRSNGLGIIEAGEVHLQFPEGGLPTQRGISKRRKYLTPVVHLETSPDNWLVVNASAPDVHLQRSLFKERMLVMGESLNGGLLDDAIALWAEFFPLIGANGILDVMQSATNDMDLTWTHEVGVFLADQIEVEEDIPLLIEVVGRKSLRMAPLHGAVWRTLEKFGNKESSSDIFRLVDEKLCFFKGMNDTMDLYMSCVHGVGHGLSMLYGVEHAREAVLICGESTDHDFQYSCATGVFMSLLEPVMDGMAPPVPISSWEPCDTVAFPAACFRFKTSSFKRALMRSVDFCDKMSDNYHMLGCIWGMAYITHHLGTTVEDAQEFCEPYHPAAHARRNHEDTEDLEIAALNLERYLTCIDGFYASDKISHEDWDHAVELCESYDIPEAVQLCKKLAAREDNNMMDGEEEFRWNYGLLERYAPFDREVLVPPAPFPRK